MIVSCSHSKADCAFSLSHICPTCVLIALCASRSSARVRASSDDVVYFHCPSVGLSYWSSCPPCTSESGRGEKYKSRSMRNPNFPRTLSNSSKLKYPSSVSNPSTRPKHSRGVPSGATGEYSTTNHVQLESGVNSLQYTTG